MYIISGRFLDAGARVEDLKLQFLGVCILGVDKHSYKAQVLRAWAILKLSIV